MSKPPPPAVRRMKPRALTVSAKQAGALLRSAAEAFAPTGSAPIPPTGASPLLIFPADDVGSDLSATSPAEEQHPVSLAASARTSFGSDLSAASTRAETIAVSVTDFVDTENCTEYVIEGTLLETGCCGARQIYTRHRYSDFLRLHNRIWGRTSEHEFPVPKLLFHPESAKRERVQQLDAYVQTLTHEANPKATGMVLEFFGIVSCEVQLRK